jgi:lipoprotein-anchoring transpeptidase ErfK/SrfK
MVKPVFLITGHVAPGVTEVRVEGADAAAVTMGAADSTGATFTVETTVHYGRTVLTLSASDGVSWSGPKTLTVWSLKFTPSRARSVLVDKSDFMLYVIRSGVVVASFPVAIGMHGTPTPTGTFYLGRPGKSPNSVWGPFRMRLYRHRHFRVSYVVRVNGRSARRWKTMGWPVGTSFYIHGTNAPGSIGTFASHGCVRLWNRNLRAFSKLTYKYQLTVIRN